MRIEQSYPPPIHGISTLAPRARPQGYASKQVNFRSDPVNKLTRRPSSLWRTLIASANDVDKVTYHSYYRDGKEYSFILDSDVALIYCTIDDILVDTLGLDTYGSDNMAFFTVDHDTYLLNKDKVVTKSPDTDKDIIEKVSHVNITSALNYSETIQINITTSDGVRSSVAYTVPELGDPIDYDQADAARATKQVALELAVLINSNGTYVNRVPNPAYPDFPYFTADWNKFCREFKADGAGGSENNPDYDNSQSICKAYLDGSSGITGVTAVALGSSIAIWEDGRAEWLQVEVEAGQGDRTSTAINRIVESTEGLPLYAVVGTRITVRPDPTSDKGIYYLQAERISDEATGETLEEVVWSEDRNPDQQNAIDVDTMPHRIQYDIDTDTFTIGSVPFNTRNTGDDESTPFPDFVGKKITTMGYFQKRLVVVAGNTVHMTETDDLENWFRQSAVTLLVTDPIAVTTSELSTDRILHLVPHNRDLLCITSNSQFKINGSGAITPETVSMPLTTKYECQVSVAPVTIGNSVYFPIDYGDSTGVQEYTGQKDTSQDFAAPVTNHIIGYLEGTAKLMAASPNLEMIAMTTTLNADNVLYIYEQYTESSGKRSQKSWCTWQFADNEKIIDIKFRKNELVLLVAKNNNLIVKALPMYTRVTTSALDVYLDDMLILDTTDGLTVEVPTEYLTDDCIIIRGAGTENELWKAKFTRTDDTLTFNEYIGIGKVYLGRTFRSEYEPNRPFKYDEDGSTITTDKIRVGKWILSLVDTHELSMIKQSTYGENKQIKFEARFVGAYNLGTIEAYTGDWKFPFAEDAGLAVPLFFTDQYLGCTISDVSWEGQYFQSKQRM